MKNKRFLKLISLFMAVVMMISCFAGLSLFSASAASSTITIRFAVPTIIDKDEIWSDIYFSFGSSYEFSYYGDNKNCKMTATNEKYYSYNVGESKTITTDGGWTVYELNLNKSYEYRVNSAEYVGFCGREDRIVKGQTLGKGNILNAGIDEYIDYYSYAYSSTSETQLTKHTISELNGKTFVICDTIYDISNYYFTGYWISDFTTVKFAAPKAQTQNSNWDGAELYYTNGGTFETAEKIQMADTHENTKITDVGDMSTLKTGYWDIYAVSVTSQVAAEINSATNVGFSKPGATNKTAFTKNVLKAYIERYSNGKYRETARTLEELEGKVFVPKGMARGNTLITYNGEWQTENTYSPVLDSDKVITIQFANPIGTKLKYDWADCEKPALYYGEVTPDFSNYGLTYKAKVMNSTDKYLSVDVSDTELTTLKSGKWRIYYLELTLDEVKEIDNSESIGFFLSGGYSERRTTINPYRTITMASKDENNKAYTGIKQSIADFDGYTFVINGAYDYNYERSTYTGSWVLV